MTDYYIIYISRLREAFNSWLNSAGAVRCTNEFDEMEPVRISDEDYEHFMGMWKRSGSTTLGDLTKFYVKGDTFQLADVFENFIDVCMENAGWILRTTLRPRISPTTR